MKIKTGLHRIKYNNDGKRFIQLVQRQGPMPNFIRQWRKKRKSTMSETTSMPNVKGSFEIQYVHTTNNSHSGINNNGNNNKSHDYSQLLYVRNRQTIEFTELYQTFFLLCCTFVCIPFAPFSIRCSIDGLVYSAFAAIICTLRRQWQCVCPRKMNKKNIHRCLDRSA